MLDVAYRIVKASDKPVEFKELAEKVAAELGFSEDEKKARIAQFYTNLSIDGRFVVLTDNYWTLREKVPYKDAHIDMTDAYSDTDDDSDDEDTEEELGQENDDDSEQENDFDNEDADEDRKAKEVDKEVGGI